MLPAKKIIEIVRVNKSDISKLSALDTNNLPAKGWVCVRLYNPTDKEYHGCIGTITCGNTESSLIDYRQYAADENGKAKDLDLYKVFDLPNNSNKSLYAEIQTSSKSARISIEVDGKIIEKELVIA